MSYSFVWLYLIKCVSYTQFLLIKHKKIFKCFNCFWKVFYFCKNFKNSVALFWRLGYGSIQSRAYTEVFRDSLVGQRPSHEKDLENFSKIWVFNVSRDSVWWLVRGWKVQSRKDLEIFAAHLATLSQVELPVAKNT